MCSAALYRQAGLQSVLEELKVNRQACSDGTLYMVPKDAWKHDKCTWLFTCLKQDASNRVQAKESSSVRANSPGGGGGVDVKFGSLLGSLFINVPYYMGDLKEGP